MSRPLTAAERLKYRGITDSATTGLKYDELYGINTAEELIIAEMYGRRAIPSDLPATMYLFSVGRGKTAKFNDEYVKASRARQAKEEEEDATGELKRVRERYIPKTMQELHEQYLNLKIPSTEEDKEKVEVQLQEVAKDFVIWCNEMVEQGGFSCCIKEKEKIENIRVE
ncbi:hypothetical protein KCU62_g833, partial [Aureobasidium sp. EXF-3399]